MKIHKIKLIEHPKAIILDNNEVSLAEYAKEYPENWKRICKGIEKKHWVDHYQKGYSNAMEEVKKILSKWHKRCWDLAKEPRGYLWAELMGELEIKSPSPKEKGK